MKQLKYFILTVLLQTTQAMAADVSFIVTDEGAAPVADAVVLLRPLDGQVATVALSAPVLRQQNTLFVPFVLPVKVGTTVSFPNFDEFRHHVYSFSKPKRFELRLYGQDETKSVLFDKTGVIALGCNIHDNMLAYIYVTDAPVFGVTDANGGLSISGLADGRYEASVWHPDMSGKPEASGTPIVVGGDAGHTSRLKIKMKSVRRMQQPPTEGTY